MSSYKKLTRHPITGKYEYAEYIDDYFMPHVYGVQFPGDVKVYPLELIDNHQLKELWAADVFDALELYGLAPEEILEFTDHLNTAYKTRWKNDPIGGEGAIDEFHRKYGTGDIQE